MVGKEETARHNVKQENGTEYGGLKSHNHVKSNHQRDVYMVSQTDNKVCLSLMHQSKQVKVTLTFPERSDQKAEQEFINRLKAVYLEKVENGAMQKAIWRYNPPPQRIRRKKTMDKKVRTLLRVSSKQQLHDDDIPVQRAEAEQYIAKRPDWVFDKEYIEKAVSAYKNNVEEREVLQEILSDAVTTSLTYSSPICQTGLAGRKNTVSM